ncbi:hypothetical protein [Mesorhizobium sp. M1396]|uniref:hypothetical protein n=1 Tax=Mesorhizobium sp. M1396 TaxID=2957095 RepID=UPI003334C878
MTGVTYCPGEDLFFSNTAGAVLAARNCSVVLLAGERIERGTSDPVSAASSLRSAAEPTAEPDTNTLAPMVAISQTEWFVSIDAPCRRARSLRRSSGSLTSVDAIAWCNMLDRQTRGQKGQGVLLSGRPARAIGSNDQAPWMQSPPQRERGGEATCVLSRIEQNHRQAMLQRACKR